jgi:hypothetical protein
MMVFAEVEIALPGDWRARSFGQRGLAVEIFSF